MENPDWSSEFEGGRTVTPLTVKLVWVRLFSEDTKFYRMAKLYEVLMMLAIVGRTFAYDPVGTIGSS